MTKQKTIILPLSFGLKENFKQDKINKELAKLANKLSKEKKLKIIAEKVISVHLPKKPFKTIAGNAINKKDYIDTYAVLLQIKKINIKKLVLVCHPAHYTRVYLTAKKLGYNIDSIHLISEIYDPQSKHIQVRSKLFFKIHNSIAYIIYYIQRKI